MIRASLVLALVAIAAPAAADSAKATRLAAEATEAANANDFKTAVVKFTEAYREDPSRTDVFCNIGISYFKLGELPRAHLLLTQCIGRSSRDLTFKDTAKAVVDSIDQTLRAANHTPVTIKVTPDNASVFVVAYGEESKFVGSGTLWLPFGTHQITARVDGFETQTVTVVTADQNPQEVPITLKALPKVEIPLIPMERQPGPSKIPPIAVSGVVVLGVVAAIFSSKRGNEEAERAAFALDKDNFDGHIRDEVQSEVDKWNRNLAISIGVASVAAVASSYLWYRALKRQPYVELKPTASGAAATFTRRF